MAGEVVTIKHKDFSLDKAVKHIESIMSDSNDFSEVSNWSSLNNLTYKNGIYIKNTALFVDIRESSNFLSTHSTSVVARLYRSYISEIVMILRSFYCCKEINIVGDCVSAIFIEDKEATINTYSGDQSDVIESLKAASMIGPTITIINNLFEKKYHSYKPIKVGIGIASGKALIVKAGESGSGISKPIFLGENINLASHLCDKANSENFDAILVNKLLKNNSNHFEAGTQKEPFSDWLSEVPETIDGEVCYGGSFYRVNINERAQELKQ